MPNFFKRRMGDYRDGDYRDGDRAKKARERVTDTATYSLSSCKIQPTASDVAAMNRVLAKLGKRK